MLSERHISIFIILLILIAGTTSADSMCEHNLSDSKCEMCYDMICDHIQEDCCNLSVPERNTALKDSFPEEYRDALSLSVIIEKVDFNQDIKVLSTAIVIGIVTVPTRTIILRC